MTTTLSRAGVTNANVAGSRCKPVPQDRRHGCCLTISGPPPDRPDLATYSQDEQLSLGAAPTWDSPDIVTNWWSPFRLMPETSVTVRNLSATASAINAQVLLYTSAFGLGMPRTLLGSQLLNLGPSQSATLLFPLTQAILNGPDQRIGTYVRIVHSADLHLINNNGSQLLADAYTSQAGRAFSVSFPVMNPLATPQQISLSVLPNTLNAAVHPTTRAFNPLEQVIATVDLSVPSTIHGTSAAPVRQDVTVVAYGQDGKLIGGLTYVIWIDD